MAGRPCGAPRAAYLGFFFLCLPVELSLDGVAEASGAGVSVAVGADWSAGAALDPVVPAGGGVVASGAGVAAGVGSPAGAGCVVCALSAAPNVNAAAANNMVFITNVPELRSPRSARRTGFFG